MKTTTLRVLIPLAILLLGGIGFVAHTGFGSLSAIGWQDIAILCPLGALGTLLASKTVVPRVLISLLIAIAGIVLLGRAFCGWICPVPVWSKLRDIFKKPEQKTSAKAVEGEAAPATAVDAPLTEKELKSLKTACGHSCHASKPSDSRHIVLGSALLSAAIFGFPVFCLVCPIGLSFAFVFVLINLFGAGDVTISVIAIPVLLLIEVVFFKKWCSHICPLSAFMSLVGKLNRTFRPTIDDSKCLETAKGATCGRCADVCDVAINPRHPELGTNWSECTKCRACVDACPGKAISMPLIAKGSGNKSTPVLPQSEV